MAEVPDGFLVHKATVQTYGGSGAYGDLYATPFTFPCLIDERRRLVRSLDGKEVISEATLIAKMAHLDRCTPKSVITLHTERESSTAWRQTTIINASLRDDGGMGAWQHLEIVTG